MIHNKVKDIIEAMENHGLTIKMTGMNGGIRTTNGS